MAVALKANPKVRWYFFHKCPEIAQAVEEQAASAVCGLLPEQIRTAEKYANEGWRHVLIDERNNLQQGG
ncbi:MAG: hypothetical protein IK099_11865 [Clostridia bacterium]|nr:hypothetical protein [Clostridia bacterium]